MKTIKAWAIVDKDETVRSIRLVKPEKPYFEWQTVVEVEIKEIK